MHRLAGIHCARSSLTGQIHETREQHVEQRESRIKQDLMDLATLQDCFEDQALFTNFTGLISIVNEVTASEESQVNCNAAEQIGADDMEFKISRIKRSEKVKTMTSLPNAVKIGDEEVLMDPLTLFSRLVVLVIKENDIASYFFTSFHHTQPRFSKME